jgi:citrate lyase subunit beta / citryl-CoA lyase
VTPTTYGLDARTFLFVPASRPDRFEKAASSGADAIIIDLEDAVNSEGKADARIAAADYVTSKPALIRINGASSQWFDDDVTQLVGAARLAGVVLPKTESPRDVATVRSSFGTDVPIFAMIESARGLVNLLEIAQETGLARLMFGNLDFALDVGITVRSPDEHELLYARSSLAVASRFAGLPGPVDGVQPKIDDDAATAASALRGVDLGFTGKLCLHPRQLPIVDAAFAPSDDDIDWAREVLRVAGNSNGSAVRVGGEMIDAPQLDLARRIIGSLSESVAQ